VRFTGSRDTKAPELQLPNPLKAAPIQRFYPLEDCSSSARLPSISFLPTCIPSGGGSEGRTPAGAHSVGAEFRKTFLYVKI
jgi:hypothetical protein